METAFFPTARFVAFQDAAPIDAASVPVFLHEVEDLHDADQDLVLADRLADAYTAADIAMALARLVGAPGPAALEAHDLGASSARLAIR
ncbi:MAG TPA: hypothetical protein VK402_02755 [Blastococcus sp.]|nr:hypothetical protein [Blastococcus sp.]